MWAPPCPCSPRGEEGGPGGDAQGCGHLLGKEPPPHLWGKISVMKAGVVLGAVL